MSRLEGLGLEDRAPEVRGIVLAGAYRSGASPFEMLGPKAALPVGLTPLVCHVLGWLRAGGVARATLCTNGASARAVRRCIREGGFADLDLDHVEDRTPRGPAGCARDAGQDARADLFLVVEGAIVPEVDLAALVSRHEETGAALTVVVTRHRGARNGAGARLSPVGIYVFDRRVLGVVPEVGYQDIKEGLVRRLRAAGEPILPYEDRAGPRVGGTRSFLAANAWVLGKMLAADRAPDGFRADGPALIHASARVAAGVRLVGPVLLGPAACVLEGAVLVGPAVVGEGATIAEGALVTRSVLLGRCLVGEDATVDRCVVAEGGIVRERAHAEDVVVPAPMRRACAERTR